MNRKFKTEISQLVFCEPVLVNSGLFSAQSRDRLYWFNWDCPPLPSEPSPIVINDILSDQPEFIADFYPGATVTPVVDKSYYGDIKGIPGMSDQHKRVHSSHTKSPTLIASHRSGNRMKVWDEDFRVLRFISPVEAERLQGFPDNWTATGVSGKPISKTSRARLIGNAFQVDTVSYLLQGLSHE